MPIKKENPQVTIPAADLGAVELANAAMKAATEGRKAREKEVLAATQNVVKLDVVLNATKRLCLSHVVEQLASGQVLQSAEFAQERRVPYHTYSVFEPGQTIDLSESNHALLLKITTLYNDALEILEGTPIDTRTAKANSIHQCFEFLSRSTFRGVAVGICHLVVEDEGQVSIAHAWELLPSSKNSGVMRAHDKPHCDRTERDIATDRVLKIALAGEVFRKEINRLGAR